MPAKSFEQIRAQLHIPEKGCSASFILKFFDAIFYRSSSSYKDWRILDVTPNNGIIGKDGKVLQDGWYMYVITLNNEIRYLPTLKAVSLNFYVRRPYQQIRFHSHLADRQNIYGAGFFKIEHESLVIINRDSGHYNPALQYLKYTAEVFKRLGIDIKKVELNEASGGCRYNKYVNLSFPKIFKIFWNIRHLLPTKDQIKDFDVPPLD